MSSVERRWQVDGIEMRGTFTFPEGGGPFPAVVMVAGSGPTDRDWCSPLIPGDNGSGRLFAEAFAAAGIASLRYDKRVSGPDGPTNASALFGKLSMQSHLDELVATVGVLARATSIDAGRIAGLGNSEGTLHVLHYAAAVQEVPFAGIVLAAPPGRSLKDVLLTQLTLQAAQIPGGAELMPFVAAAVERFEANQPMNLDPRLPDAVKLVLASFESPANLPLARELFTEDTTASLSEVAIPTLVLIGRKDVQIDAVADGGRLEQATAGKRNVVFAYPDHANHVFKHDARPLAEVMTNPGVGYNEEGTYLDPEALETIVRWLAGVLA